MSVTALLLGGLTYSQVSELDASGPSSSGAWIGPPPLRRPPQLLCADDVVVPSDPRRYWSQLPGEPRIVYPRL